MVNKCWPVDRPSGRIAQQHCVAISQGRLPAAAHRRAEPAYVEMKAEIVVPITAIAMRMHVSHAPHGSRQQAKPGQFANAEVDIADQIRNWIEPYPGQALVVEGSHGIAVCFYPQGSYGRMGHVVSPRRALPSPILSGGASRRVTISTESRPVPVGMPAGPSQPDVKTLCRGLAYGGDDEQPRQPSLGTR